MMFEQEAVIRHESGIHARIAAMIVQRAKDLGKKYGTPLFLRSERSERCEMHSLMKLVALKISCGDSVFVAAEGDEGRQAVYEMVRFLESDFEMNSPGDIHEMDLLIDTLLSALSHLFLLVLSSNQIKVFHAKNSPIRIFGWLNKNDDCIYILFRIPIFSLVFS